MSDLLIDVHSHPLLPVWIKAFADATGQNVDSVRLAGVPLPRWSEQAQIDMMDRIGIAASVFSLPGAVTAITGKAAARFARILNEEIANIMARHPGRFGAFAVVPLDDIDLAIEETRYALDVLHLDGVGAATHQTGHYLGEPHFDDWFAELDRREATLFVHPVPPPGYMHRPGAPDPSILEFMFDTSRMLLNMVLSGAKARHQRMKVISTHAGGTIPYLVSRIGILEPHYGAGGDRPTQSAEQLRDAFGSFYFDLAGSPWPATLDAIRHLVPPEQLLLGFDYPMMPAETAVTAIDSFRAYRGFDAGARAAIEAGNAARLLPGLAARMART